MDSVPYEEIKAALRHVPADDRDTWVRIGMACHAAGDDMFGVWDAWSQTSEAYDERAALTTWRSFKPGAIGLGTLFHIARLHGYAPGALLMRQVRSFDEGRGRRRKHAERQRVEAQQTATQRAQRIVSQAVVGHHSYISRKGFPTQQMLIYDGMVVVPMRDVRSGELVSVQTINREGRKRFLKGGRKKDTMFKIGRGRETWLCEGLATALSLQMALTHLQRRDFSVVVTFDAYNFVSVAAAMRERSRRGVAVADNDPWRCQGCNHRWHASTKPTTCPSCGSSRLAEPVGVVQAHKTRLPVYVPSKPGDANDLHMDHGLEVLCDELRAFLGIGVDSDAHGSCRRCGGSMLRHSREGGYDLRCIACGREVPMPL